MGVNPLNINSRNLLPQEPFQNKSFVDAFYLNPSNTFIETFVLNVQIHETSAVKQAAFQASLTGIFKRLKFVDEIKIMD